MLLNRSFITVFIGISMIDPYSFFVFSFLYTYTSVYIWLSESLIVFDI